MTAGVPPADPYPNSIVTTNIFDKVNNAVGSKTMATIRTQAPTLDDVLYRFAARENIYILWAGTNDLYNTYDVATTFKNLEATCRERQKKGFKVIVLTTLPRCGFAADGVTTMSSLILSYNTLIRQRWSTFADNIADVASNSTLSSVNPCIDTTYYNGDGIHLTNTGNALLLPYVQDAINAVSVQTTFQDVDIKGKIVNPIKIQANFGTTTPAQIIYNPERITGNAGILAFEASSTGFGDNRRTASIESISNGASNGQSVLNIKVAEFGGTTNTILSMDGVSKASTFSGAVNATTYNGGASLTGVPTAPTAIVGTNNTQIATTAFVNAEIANDAPTKSGTGATGTWGIGISGNAATATTATGWGTSGNQYNGTVSSSIQNYVLGFGTDSKWRPTTDAAVKTWLGLGSNAYTSTAYAPLASPSFTGTPTAPTPTAGDNSTKIATTAFVTNAVSSITPSYLVYTALLSQSGTSAPTATVLQNTLGGTVVWSYVSTGQYAATLTGAFTVNKTVTFVNQGATSPMAEVKFNRQDANSCTLRTYQVNTTTSTDTVLANDVSMVEIRVYP